MNNDRVQHILEQWQKERPDLDPSPIAIIGRISRLSRRIEQDLEKNYSRYNLQGGTYDLLATLRRNGTPYTLTPTQLQGEMMLSSGATTHRIDLLEKRGLVERQDDPNDRRGTLVKLTGAGEQLIDQVAETHMALERKLLASLSDEQQVSLASLLAALSWHLESES